eukprot:Nk52_evm31s2531 gene=Nk52_evmTU31s2531
MKSDYLNTQKLKVTKRKLFVPPLTELAQVIEAGLLSTNHFSHVKVDVVMCPDLSSGPWDLAGKGICGNPRLADVGGTYALLPTPQFDKEYSYAAVASACEFDSNVGLIMGPGLCNPDYSKVNAEMIANYNVGSGLQKGRWARVCTESGESVLDKYECESFKLLGNMFLSEGKDGGKVLRINATTKQELCEMDKISFSESIRQVLREKYHAGDDNGDHTTEEYARNHAVGFGGIFQISEGIAKFHIMPDFSKTPLNTPEDVKEWLRFYDFSGPLTCLSTFISDDLGLGIRVEHTHGYSSDPKGSEGGHYHYGYNIGGCKENRADCDGNGAVMKYFGYFNPAEFMYKVDLM